MKCIGILLCVLVCASAGSAEGASTLKLYHCDGKLNFVKPYRYKFRTENAHKLTFRWTNHTKSGKYAPDPSSSAGIVNWHDKAEETGQISVNAWSMRPCHQAVELLLTYFGQGFPVASDGFGLSTHTFDHVPRIVSFERRGATSSDPEANQGPAFNAVVQGEGTDGVRKRLENDIEAQAAALADFETLARSFYVLEAEKEEIERLLSGLDSKLPPLPDLADVKKRLEQLEAVTTAIDQLEARAAALGL